MMTKQTTLIAVAAILAILVLPASAAAEYLVPEGNSAVNQYTEGYPTAGGEKGSDSGKETEKIKPAKTIGAGNAKKLESKGPEGTAVAEVAAETAPPDVTVASDPSATQGQGKSGNTGKQGSGSKDKSGKQNGSGTDEEEATAAPTAGNGDSGSSGSSGIGELVSAATGTESGHLGLLLPLVILAAIAWAFAFAWRQRKRPTAE
jgi:hypothetical protein